MLTAVVLAALAAGSFAAGERLRLRLLQAASAGVAAAALLLALRTVVVSDGVDATPTYLLALLSALSAAMVIRVWDFVRAEAGAEVPAVSR